MSHKDGRVVLSAWVDPVLRDCARKAAKLAHLEFSRWVERAVRQTMARESAERAIVAASERGECGTCGYAPCGCDQKTMNEERIIELLERLVRLVEAQERRAAESRAPRAERRRIATAKAHEIVAAKNARYNLGK